MKRAAHLSCVQSIGTLLSAILCFPAVWAQESEAGRMLPPIRVLADAQNDTSPYRTAGDVDVITRDEIEENHYSSIRDAIKRLPGVQVSGPGYRAQEYGLWTYTEDVSINGDNSVIIMVDGRRLDSDASSYGGSTSRSKVSLDTITNINNIERIEVVKGTGSVAYGADATGGVINIVTRRGSIDHETTADVAAGSWQKRNYALTQSGSFSDGSLRYFASLGHQESANTKYEDAYTDRTETWYNTHFQDTGASLRLSKEINADHELTLYYSGTNSLAGYPITAPDYATIDLFYESRLPSGSGANQRPGYRNWFIYDAALDSYTRSRSNDIDLKYAFDKQGDLESYVRVFRNYRRYKTRLFGGLFGIQLEDVTAADIERARASAGREQHETVHGAQLQMARRFDRHNVITGWTYDTSEHEDHRLNQDTHAFVDRDSLTGFVQDKIEVTDRWTLTPGVQYSQYSEIKRKSASGVSTQRDESRSHVTFAAYSSFDTGVLGEFYASWAQIFRPKSNNDFNSETAEILGNEEGTSWTVGLKKALGGATTIDLNYALTDMSNAIARYSVWDPTATNTSSPTGLGSWVNRSVNATQEKEALNIGIDHRFSDHWAVRASYSYVKDEFAAKNAQNNPDDTNVNALINKYRPSNKYQADVSYWWNRWSATLSAELSTGIDERYFTDDSFLWYGLTTNYDLFQSTRLYLVVENLTNIHYETRGHATFGRGAFPQPARNFMLGVNQKF